MVEDTSDPTSRLTQAAMTAVNAIFRARCASALLPITYIDAVPLSQRNVSNLLPGKWMNDEVMNGYTTLLQRRHAETREDTRRRRECTSSAGSCSPSCTTAGSRRTTRLSAGLRASTYSPCGRSSFL